MSYVLAGGVLAGVVGAQLINATMNSWPPHVYAVTYLGAAAVAGLSAFVLWGVQFERRPAAAKAGGRPMREVLRQPQLVVAMFCGVVTYMMMNFMMTSAPLAMELCGIARIHANHGIEMHVIAMYAPSFFTGRLIARFGEVAIVMAGLVLTALAAVTGMSGLSVNHFLLSLVLLGVGWNFGFLGASAMVLKSHSSDEGPRVQSVNDFVVFGTMAVGSFLSGGLLNRYGWEVVSELVLAPVALAAVSLALLRIARPYK
jgi:cyanate permease